MLCADCGIDEAFRRAHASSAIICADCKWNLFANHFQMRFILLVWICFNYKVFSSPINHSTKFNGEGGEGGMQNYSSIPGGGPLLNGEELDVALLTESVAVTLGR